MAKRNLAELETAKRETEILYAASRRFTHASTIAGLLDAVSDYPRERGAFNGQLFTFPEPATPDRMEAVATWGMYPDRRLPVGFVIELEQRPFARYWLSRPDAPTLIPDVMNDEHVDGPTRQIFARLGARGLALLPLFTNGRWIGVISYYWETPYAFDARDTRIFTALEQQLTPVLDSLQLAEQTQKRAAELERAKHEMDVLLDASRLLVRASTSAQLLEAVSAYARQNGAVSGTLFYFDQYEPRWLDVVASWASDPAHLIPPGARFDIASTPAAQVWLHRPEHPFLLPDGTALDAIDPQTQAHLRTFQLRGVAQLPLFTNGRWIGALLFGWDRPYAFTERDTRIFTVLQQQLAPVADSLLLFEESQRRAAWAERLARTNAALSQATDERSILMAAAELGDELIAGWSALAYTLPGNARSMQFVAVRTPGDAPPPDDLPLTMPVRIRDYPHLQMVFDAPDQPLFVEDRLDDTRGALLPRRLREAALPWRAFVGIPLKTAEQWQGVLCFYWETARLFGVDLRAALAAIMPSTASVVAIRRAYQAEQEAREENELLYRASQGINDANSPGEMIAALERLKLSAFNIVLAVWEQYDRARATYVEIVAGSQDSTWPIGARLTPSEVALAYTSMKSSLLVVEDTADRSQIDAYTAATVERQGHRAFMLVPLVLASRTLGFLAFESRTPRSFTPHEVRLASGIGELITSALERIRLKEQSEIARKHAEKLAEQAKRLAALEERTRLARELHDSVSQALYGIGLGARTARALQKIDPSRLNEPLDYIISLAEAGLTEMRALIFELRPESLEQEGIITALSKQAASLQARHGVHVDTAFCEEPAVPVEVKEGLYRIALEALHNTVRHAQATQVNLSLLCDGPRYRLQIVDNGLGFDASQSFPGHLGLKSMRERAASLGGQFDLTSTPGQGTRITVTLQSPGGETD